MNGDSVLCVLVSWLKQVLFVLAFDGSEFKPINTSSVSVIDPSLSFESADEPDAKLKLKLKVGVVSVTVKQHAEDWLQDGQSMLDL